MARRDMLMTRRLTLAELIERMLGLCFRRCLNILSGHGHVRNATLVLYGIVI